MMFISSLKAQGIWCTRHLLSVISALLLSIGSIAPALTAGSAAHLAGKFDPLHNWPIIPIAVVLMPDGRVFAYGTTPTGAQTAKLHYAIWDPSAGTGASAFEVLPNITETDIFCGGQALIPETGHALILGGDAMVNTKRNYANRDVNIFDPYTDTLIRQTQSMSFRRWYATAVTMPNGEHTVLGGRDSRYFEGTSTIPATEATFSPIPEVRSTDGSWRTLDSAISDTAYGKIGASWFYPRAWVNPRGKLFILAHNGTMYELDTANTGKLSKYKLKISASLPRLPSVMFAPNRILSIRKDRAAVVVDISNTGEPVITSGGTLARDHQYGNAIVLADGQVWVSGGSSSGNSLSGMILESELWNPNTNTWTKTASAATARLYHSTSLLLPDGTVFTGGGGAPGPIKQLNGEIFHPPYLFKKDGSGEFAPRPSIIDAPTTMLDWNQEFSIEATASIAKVTLVRAGAVTHNYDNEARFFDLPVSQAGRIVTVKTPATPNIAPPGFYLLFVWNAWGVPSIAKIVQIG